MTHYRSKQKVLFAALLILIIPLCLLPLTIGVRAFDHTGAGYTRVVFQGDSGFEYNYKEKPSELTITLKKKALLPRQVTDLKGSRLVDKVVHTYKNGKSVLNVRFKEPYAIKKQFVLERPFRLVFDVVKSGKKPAETSQPTKASDEPPVQEPEPLEKKKDDPLPEEKQPEQPREDTPPDTAAPILQDPTVPPQQESTPAPPKRREQIEIICIDPGHGGNDMGAISPNKVAEKDITLKLGKKLRELIASRLGLRVVMTRDKDAEVSLNSRVSIANNQKAQMFVSIHVNSSYRRAARGSETFYVSLKATDQEAFQLSQKENQSFEEIEEMTQDDDLKMILWDMAQNEYIKESSKLAEYIQNELNVLLHTLNRGVKQAPFRVLMRAAMPAVLVEVAFLSNPVEESKLQNDDFLNKVAGAVYSGISKYIYYHNSLYGYRAP